MKLLLVRELRIKEMRDMNRKRFNLLDFFIIIVFVAVIGGGLYLYNQYTEGLKRSTYAVEYQVELRAVDQSFVDAITKGDLLRESVKGNTLGRVADMTYKDSYNINIDYLAGKYVETAVPDKLDVILTIASPASVSERSIIVGGLEIKIGHKLFVKGKGYAREGYILNIVVKE
jgi:hypothetical protein